MKTTSLGTACVFLLGLSVAGFAPDTARAITLDTLTTFDVSATFSSPSSPSYGLTGMFTVDQTRGFLTFADLVVTGFTSPQNSFDTASIDGFTYPSDSSIQFRFQNTDGYTLLFTADFSPPDFTGSNILHFNGGEIVAGSFSDGLVASGLTGEVTNATPLPAALPLFATGLGAMGLFGWRRKRKNTAAIAA